MNKNLIKGLGILATVVGFAATFVSDWVAEQKLDEKINEKVNEALAEREKECDLQRYRKLHELFENYHFQIF